MKILRLLLLPFICFGLEFDEMMKDALMKSPKVLAKYEKVLASRDAIDATAVYKNPIISFGINDMPLNSDFLKRDIDSMQSEFIGISQEFDTFAKLELKESMLRVDTLILEYELEDLKIELYRDIGLLVEDIFIKEAILEKLELQKLNLELLLEYYEKNISLEDGLKTSVELSRKIFEIEDKSFEIKDSIVSLKHEFKYLTSRDFDDINRANISEGFFKDGIKNSPAAKALELRIKRFEIQSRLEQREKYSNITLNVSYNHRQKFEDYLSFSASFALPIYGAEDAKVKIAKSLSHEAIQEQRDFFKRRGSLFDKNKKRVEFFQKRVSSLEDLEHRYYDLKNYENSNISNSVTIEKQVENENLLLELEVERLKYNLEIKKALFELYYITKEYMP